MSELLTAAQMRAIEQAAIESGEVTGLELMERAGRGVVEAVFEEWPELAKTSHRAVVLCGPGNNGGDGFVVARLLKDWGWEVEVFLYGDPEKLPPDARVNYERSGELGEVATLSAETWDRSGFPGSTDIIVDALFGTGLMRPVDLPLVSLSATPELGQHHRLVAVDLPSGLCSDSGKVLKSKDGEMVAGPAEITVTFHSEKVGHRLHDGPSICGKTKIVDIGLPTSRRGNEIAPRLWSEATSLSVFDLFHTDVVQSVRSLPLPSKHSVAHKYHHGHAVILSGPSSKGGAARLAARGALRIGAGLVTIAAPPDAVPEHAAQLNAIMLRPVADADALARVLEDDRLNALCLGPGLGVGEDTRKLVKVALGMRRGCVLDADALTSFEANPSELFDLLRETCVLTPHAGEFARLFPDIAERLAAPATKGPAYSKVDATRAAAARTGCTVLFKGPDTVIADPDGNCRINSAHYDRAAPWLATAGSGDVLAGFITGLLARGFGALEAASSAAWLHVEAARSFGPGLIAEDLPEELPRVFRSLGM